MWLLEMLVTLRYLLHLAPLAKEFGHFSKGKGTDVHTPTLKQPHKTGLSYRQQRNLFGVLALVVTLAFGEDFQRGFCPRCAVSTSFWHNTERGLKQTWDTLPVSLSEITRIREIADGSMHLIRDILNNCPVLNLPGAPQLLDFAVHSPTLLLLKKNLISPGLLNKALPKCSLSKVAI